METLGSRQVSACVPKLALAHARLGTGGTQKTTLPWRTWDWAMSEVGRCTFDLDPLLGVVHLEGTVSGLVLDGCVPCELANARLMLLCPLCTRRLCKRGFLLAERTGGRLRVGCSRCVAPPVLKNMPSVVEVRDALEALSRRRPG